MTETLVNIIDRMTAPLLPYFSLDTAMALVWVACTVTVALVVGIGIRQYVRAQLHARAKKIADQSAEPESHYLPDGTIALPMAQRILLRILRLLPAGINFALVVLGIISLRRLGFDAVLLDDMKPLFLCWILLSAVYAVTDSKGKTAFVALLLVPLSLPFMQPTLEDLRQTLADLSFSLGKISINAYMVLKLFISGLLLMWVAAAISAGIGASLERLRHIRWSTRQLLQNLSTIGIYAIAVLVVLSVIGVDLTAFAVLGGAIGVGIGLGLQKIASNFISGLILLGEQTVQVNDMIEIEGSNLSGLVRHTGARYTLIQTLDNREVMIPNEDLITNRVINWTYSNARGVLRIEVGVSYDSDLDVVREQLLAAAQEHSAVLKHPSPACFLMAFADSSVNFMLIVHIEDVRQGRLGIQSDLLFDIWRRFKEKGIEIPFPQMTLHQAKPWVSAAEPAPSGARDTRS